MKNLLVANEFVRDKRYDRSKIDLFVKAQIDNSLELGWKPEDIILIANYQFDYKGIESIELELNKVCRTGSKMFAIKWCYKYGQENDTIWAHDLDAWQNVAFAEPDENYRAPDIGEKELEKMLNGFARADGDWDVAGTFYSRAKFNGGSIFWRPSSIDIIDNIVNTIETNKEAKEEPTINSFFNKKEYRGRIAVLDNTYNVGCSGFVPRWERSTKPIRVCHLHPTNRLAWETHALDRNGQDMRSVTPRLERLLRRYWTMATEMHPDGEAKARRLRNARIKKLFDGKDIQITAQD